MLKVSTLYFRSIAALLQILLVTGSAFADPSPTPKASQPADISNWKDTCSHVKSKEEMLKTYTSDSCLAKEKCKQEAMMIVESNYGQIGPTCKAAELASKGKAMEIVSVVAYGAAAALCMTACATNVFKTAKQAEQACTYSGLAATAVDLGMTVGLIVQKKKLHEWYNAKDGKAFTGMEIAGTAMGAAAVGTSLYKNKKTMDLQVVKLQGTEDAAKANENLKPGEKEKQGGKAGSCFSGVLLGATAAIKGLAIKKAKDLEKSIQENVNKLGSDMLSKLENLDRKFAPGSGSGNFLAANQSGASNKTASPSSKSPIDGLTNDFLGEGNPTVHAALAGSYMEDFLKKVAPKGVGKKGLDDLGFNPQKFAAKINSGATPSAAMGEMMPSLPKEMLKEISELEDLARSGQIAMNGSSSGTSYAASKAHSPSSGGSEIKELNFGDDESKEEENLTPTLDFDGRKPAAAAAAVTEDDIYHANYSGSIFDIISQRLAKFSPDEE